MTVKPAPGRGDSRKCGAATVAMVLLLLLAACGEPRLDTAQLERDVAQQLASELQVTPAVSCPFDGDQIAIRNVVCVISIDGQPDFEADVVVDVDADTAEVIVLGRLVGAAQIERLVAQEFVNDLGITTTVRCPGPVVVATAVPTECTAVDARGIERPLLVEVDPAGAVAVRLG